MRIRTARFGVLELNNDRVIHFPWGMPGFEGLKRYVLLEYDPEPLRWLQAVDDPNVAFIVCPPEALGVKYYVPHVRTLPLGLESKEDLLVLIMISINRVDLSIRPHLRGPLLFNIQNRSGYQWTMDSKELDQYLRPMKEPRRTSKL